MLTIMDLANELQIKIFEYCVLEPAVSGKTHGDERFILAAVCRRWRSMILNDPLLWQSIVIDRRSVIPYLLPSDHLVGSVVSVIKHIFSRTCFALKCGGNRPIDLTITVPDRTRGSIYFTSQHARMLAKILKDQAHRIASITISGNDWAMQVCALSLLRQLPMPLLHTFDQTIQEFLHIDDEEDRYYVSQFDPGPILQIPNELFGDLTRVNAWGREQYPNIQNIHIYGALFNWRGLPTPKGLRKLSLGKTPPMAWERHPALLEMLSFCAPTLEELELSHLRARPYPISEPVIFPALTKLSLDYDNPDEVTKFLPCIRTPSLKNFELSAPYSPPDSPTLPVLMVLMQYLPLHQLESLTLKRVVFEDDLEIPEFYRFLFDKMVAPATLPYMMRFLGMLTSLKHLRLFCVDMDNHLLSLINYPAEPSYGEGLMGALHGAARMQPPRYLAYLPALETLTLAGYLEADEVYDFLNTRVQFIYSEKPLRVSLNAYIARRFDDARLAEVQALIAKLAGET